jgi:hypothetical protein
MRWLGALALIGYFVHGSGHLAQGHPEDLLWACHIGAALVGIGLLIGSAAINGVGVALLALGTPLWLLDLSTGGEFLPTSLLTHILGLVIGLYGVRRLGLPAGVWWKATVSLIALIALCRLFTPASANVNVAFAIPHPWEQSFPSHSVYLATVLTVATGYFFILEFVLRRWLAPRDVAVSTSTGEIPQ